MAAILFFDPGVLRLPPSRKDGADPFKLADQIRRFGDIINGMPPLLVTLGMNDELMINDGVTRAVRVATLRPGTIVPVEIIEVRPNWSFNRFRRVREVL